jgi:tetratricopeptide (TPR) repeat protein
MRNGTALGAENSIQIARGVRLEMMGPVAGPAVDAGEVHHPARDPGLWISSDSAPAHRLRSRKISPQEAHELWAIAPPPPARPKPGLLAPAFEKAFHKAVRTYAYGDLSGAAALFKESAVQDERDEALADDLFAGLLSAQADDDASAICFLEKVVASYRTLPDELMKRYAQGWYLHIEVTEHVTAVLPFGSLTAALVLGECYRRTGRSGEAVGLLAQLVDVGGDPLTVLSLCALLVEAEAWDEIVNVAAGTRNEDDASLEVMIYQARALEAQGIDDAALVVYTEALRIPKRRPQLLKEARYGRGKLFLRIGKKEQGKRDLAHVYADDPSYRDVAEALGAVG